MNDHLMMPGPLPEHGVCASEWKLLSENLQGNAVGLPYPSGLVMVVFYNAVFFFCSCLSLSPSVWWQAMGLYLSPLLLLKYPLIDVSS
jgi:hypothetical protein